MYNTHRKLWQCQLSICTCIFATVLLAGGSTTIRAQELQSSSVIRKISAMSDKMELTTNTSRILTLDKNIPRVQVNNPELLAVTPLSATQVQISAKKPGVTQVNLWDSDGKIHTIDVLIYGDARELEIALQTQFPHASIKVFRYSESLVLTGYVDRPDHVSPIMQLAQDYSPKVINNISVGGVQQILLKVKVMEVSRTKLRDLGMDWALLDGSSILAASNVSGLLQPGGSILSSGGNLAKVGGPITSDGQTFQFGVFHGNDAFLGFLSALQECRAAKILANPNLVAVSGRPAQFQVGGEFPVLIPQSLGTTTIEFKPYGTQVDFLPIVLGNGNIRLEVRPRISDIDPALSVTLVGSVIPALTVRQVDTAVEMKAGQTFALGGLIQERTETLNSGLPYLSDVPIVGVPFRRTHNKVNEIELLITVTPEFVDPIDGCEVPCGGPGTYSTSPNNRGLYCGGHMEVPTACNPTSGLGSCGQDPCGQCNNSGCNTGCQRNGGGPFMNGIRAQGMPPQNMMPTPVTQMPGGTGYDDSTDGTTTLPSPDSAQSGKIPTPVESIPASNTPQELTLPESAPKPTEETKPATQPPMPPQSTAPVAPEAPLSKPMQTPPAAPVPAPTPNSGTYYLPAQPSDTYMPPANSSAESPAYTSPRSYTPQRQPVFVRNATRPNNPQPQQAPQAASARENSLIGPIGYDVQQ